MRFTVTRSPASPLRRRVKREDYLLGGSAQNECKQRFSSVILTQQQLKIGKSTSQEGWQAQRAPALDSRHSNLELTSQGEQICNLSGGALRLPPFPTCKFTAALFCFSERLYLALSPHFSGRKFLFGLVMSSPIADH
jgi:hypothetical protein